VENVLDLFFGSINMTQLLPSGKSSQILSS
jgi:hypothetical protein